MDHELTDEQWGRIHQLIEERQQIGQRLEELESLDSRADHARLAAIEAELESIRGPFTPLAGLGSPVNSDEIVPDPD